MEVLISKTSFYFTHKLETRTNLYYNDNGDSINKIEIYISNLYRQINIIINPKLKEIIINNQTKNIEEEKLNNLIRIIRTWKPLYKSNKIIDGDRFLIKVTTEEGEDIIQGENSYPENYNLLIDWIGELYD